MKGKIPVAVLGATGSVGQKFIELLADHPWFKLIEITASDRSEGKKYSDVVNWILPSSIPEPIKNMVVSKSTPNLKSRLIFSALDSSVAGDIETEFALNGYFVISNARNHRFDNDVPLIIPEVNPDHLLIIRNITNKGAIITNPNCSTIGLALALKPLYDNFGIEAVNVVTLQAVSGAGYPGLPSIDIIDNVIPFISGEEEKMETEPLKIFGSLVNSKIDFADFKISAQCNRVAVIDGHTECVQVKLKSKTTPDQIIKSWNDFSALPQKLKLPSAPERPIIYFYDDKYPQPKIQRNIEKGMAVSVGRLRECPLFDFKFTLLSHNTVRGAAGGTILISELLKAEGYLNEIL